MQAHAILPRFAVNDPDETARIGCMVRAMTAKFDGFTQTHLVGVTRDGRGIISSNPLEYGNAEAHIVQKPGTAAALLAEVRVYAESNSRDLVSWNPDSKTATFATLTPTVRSIRAAWARILKVQPHEVDVFAEYAKDEPRFERIVARLPSTSITADRRVSNLQELAAAIPGYTSGWNIEENARTGRVDFTYGVPRALPDSVPLTSLLPVQATDSTWRCFPMGEGTGGTQVIYDSEDGVHAIVTGPTGSGKSVLLRTMMAVALANGSDIVIMDGSPKQGLDFLRLKGYALGWAGEPVGAAALLDAVYDEMKRRASILPQYDGVTNWHELPADVREREGIRQLVVFIDEAAALMLLKDLKGLDKNDPKVAAAIAVNQAKTNFKMTLDDLARESRFVGIRLILGFQRPDASIIDGPTRANFPTMVQLKTPGKPLKQESLRMVFPGDDLPLAEAEFRALDNGRKGLAVAMQDGGDVVGFRVAYAHPDEISGLLAERGIHPTGRTLTPVAEVPALTADPVPPEVPAAWR
ncbi:FtsK/SpoIIIE domain-containing protein [Microbacterium sp. BWR-S6Y]|uniref:FtsK/SpoIIIE domain-containing protein n=1 Tax=Microbacterium sp. BWR-S6Y TaxID=3232073 RepID=UPI003528FA83